MNSDFEKSILERARKVTCRAPSRERHDDQIVELFLSSWEDGRFVVNPPEWLPQNVKNVEVIARDQDGNRLAVEHTRIHAFEDHQREEALLAPIAKRIEAEAGLDFPDRRFDILFYPDFLNGLQRPHYKTYTDALLVWLSHTLPQLAVRVEAYPLQVPPLGTRKEGMKIDVTVSDRIEGLGPVSVSGMLPEDSERRVLPLVRKALDEKLSKLTATEAEFKILLIELPTIDTSPTQIVGIIRDLQSSHGELASVHHIVIARTFNFETDRRVCFFAYEIGTFVLADVSRVNVLGS